MDQPHIVKDGTAACPCSSDPGSSHEPLTIDQLLLESRAGLERVQPSDLEKEMAAGALVVDTRPVDQRDRDGDLPGAVVIDRNVLEWRLDPSCPHRLPIADDPTRRIVVVCNEGYSSSLAAHTLQRLGLRRATDLIGGFQAWAALRADS
ncbi:MULTISPECIES: rhodanese-like domain-containing protein [Micrococcaceae]|uniref:rhodanese-like domain-containing protein n=1 Tax=Micrococcaceae TaxID=1268 RepID=UPI002D788764|nr:rhodanese-like domain-containing protein [Pseudarthrobacter sp. LT1]WRT15873.1 rhodanese-like domain-containing protein [Pseudarthrobacter sp. LT1]